VGRTVICGRYELEALPLGRGGMGEIYDGYDRKLDRRVAVKLIRFPCDQPDESMIKRFTREARIMARLNHPGAPTIYDADVYDDPLFGPRPFMVMEFVEGITLEQVLDEHEPPSIDWAAAAAAQVAAVLCAAHERGILHRDLKPSNLMLRRDGTVVVLDFGLALLHDPEVSRLTRTGTVLGTPAYMSPEQILGATVGPQSDIYALGLVLHELLTGRRVFDGTTDYQIFERQVNEPAPPVSAFRPDVPAELDRLVLRMLNKRAEERPKDAAEVYESLLAFVTGVSPLPGTVEPGPSPVRMYAGVVSRIASGGAAQYAHDSRVTAAVSRSAGTGMRAAAGIGRGDIARARAEAASLARESRYSQAVKVLESVLEPAIRAFGGSDPDVLDLRIDMAEMLFEKGDYRQAAPAFAALYPDLAVRYGEHDERVFRCRRREATCYGLMGRTDTALRLLTGLLADEEAAYGAADPRPLELRRQIGLLELGTGETERARSTLTALLQDLLRVYGPDHPEVHKVRDSISRLTI